MMMGRKMTAAWLAGAAVLAAAAVPMMATPATEPVMAAATAGTETAVVEAAATATEPGVAATTERQWAATTAPTAPAPAGKGQASGGDGGVKCLVKSFEPVVLKTWDRRHVAFSQSKLVCTDTVGTSETLIEQNDQIVIADTVVNNQTSVSLHNLTLRPNDEQWKDAFCLGVAQQGLSAGFRVIAQECAPLSNFGGYHHGWER